MFSGGFVSKYSRLRGIVRASLGCVGFVILVTVLNWSGKFVFAGAVSGGVRARATVELSSGMLAEIVFLLLLWAYLRRCGVSFEKLGLWRRAPALGWIAGAATAALFIAFNLALPLRGNGNLTEISWFHFYNALSAGLVAGFVEETFFRGFIMNELWSAGFGTTGQVMASSLLYGAVHSAWGLTSGLFTFALVGGAVIGTGIFGLFCAGVYVLSRRSLMPAIACHALVDFVIEPWMFMVAITMYQR
jgi:membrane protease YdiL (CAAX protease family)